jgi:hypothetical protein
MLKYFMIRPLFVMTVVEGDSKINSNTGDGYASERIPMVVELVGKTTTSSRKSTRKTSPKEFSAHTTKTIFRTKDKSKTWLKLSKAFCL